MAIRPLERDVQDTEDDSAGGTAGTRRGAVSLQIPGFAPADAMDPVVHLCSCALATVTPLGERRRRPR